MPKKDKFKKSQKNVDMRNIEKQEKEKRKRIEKVYKKKQKKIEKQRNKEIEKKRKKEEGPFVKRAFRRAPKSLDYVLFIDIIILLVFGLTMVQSASAPTSLAENSNSYSLFVRQAIVAGVGVFCMIGISFIDYRIYKEHYWFFYIFGILLLFLTKLPVIGARS